MASDDNNVLDKYAQIIVDFNEKYGTSYKIATPEELERTGSNIDEIEDLFIQMSEDEFYNYIYNAYLIDVADKQNQDITFGEHNNVVALPNINLSEINDSNGVNNSGVQHYYYRGSTTESLAVDATWWYGDGDYRYSSYATMGYTYTPGHYPYYVPYDSSYSIINLSREMACTYNCNKYIANGITDATNWTVNVNFVAGGGDVWGALYA
ncbi:MAG: hypothetical protein K2O60_04530 [Ruminococcus sp.]|nr:hypothetical protein [Ruminococcus sp.]